MSKRRNSETSSTEEEVVTPKPKITRGPSASALGKNWSDLVDEAERLEEQVKLVAPTRLMSHLNIHSESTMEEPLGRPIPVEDLDVQASDDEDEQATKGLDEGEAKLLHDRLVVIEDETKLLETVSATGNLFSRLMDFLGSDDEWEPEDVEERSESENFTSEAPPSFLGQKTEVNETIVTGQLDMAMINLLCKKFTDDNPLSAVMNLDEKYRRFKQILPVTTTQFSTMPDYLGPLLPSRRIDPVDFWETFNDEKKNKYLGRKAIMRVKEVPFAINYSLDDKSYREDLYAIAPGRQLVLETPDGTCYDVGRVGPRCDFDGELKIECDEKTNEIFSTLYDQGDTPTTGLGYSTALHFYCVVLLSQHCETFTVEENMIDIKINGYKFEVSTKNERNPPVDGITIDKYTIARVCGDGRMSKLSACSYFADKNMPDGLCKVRRSKELNSLSKDMRDFDDACWDFLYESKRLQRSHLVALSALETESQLKGFRRSTKPIENFEENKQRCIKAIEDCIDWSYTEAPCQPQWGCSTPFKMIRRGNKDITSFVLKPDWLNVVNHSPDAIDGSNKQNYWVQKEDLEKIEEMAISIDSNKELWGHRDNADNSNDVLSRIFNSLIVSKPYSSSQVMSAVATVLRRSKRSKNCSFEYILDKTCLAVWTSSYSVKSKSEKYKVRIVRCVEEFFDEASNYKLLEGIWRRIEHHGHKVEVSPMFTVCSTELDELNAQPRRCLNLYYSFFEKFKKMNLVDLIKNLNVFFLATVGGTWKTTTIVGSHRYLCERIMSGYIDPKLIEDKICKPEQKLKLYCEYYYLILIKRALLEWDVRYKYVAQTPVFRFPTTFMGLEMNMHYMMGSVFDAGTDHRETCLRKTLEEIIGFKGREPIIKDWIKKQTSFVLSLSEKMDPQDRLARYMEIREPPVVLSKKNCAGFLSFLSCSAKVSKDIIRNQPGNYSGYASLASLVTNKALLKIETKGYPNKDADLFIKTRSSVLMKENEPGLWCKTVVYASILEIERGSPMYYYYFPKEGAQKGDREISTMSPTMRYSQVIAESCVTRLSEDMYGDTMVDKAKRTRFYRMTRKKKGYKNPGSSSEDRSRFGPNLMPVQMGVQMSILSTLIGDASIASTAMCVTLSTDKIGIMPTGVNPFRHKTERMTEIFQTFVNTHRVDSSSSWVSRNVMEDAFCFQCKVSMGQGIYGRTAGVIHNVVLLAHEAVLMELLGVFCEHLVSSDDVYRNVSVKETEQNLSGVSILLFTSEEYKRTLVASGTIDSEEKGIKTVHISEYNNETVLSDPRMNPDPSIVEMICAVNRLPHSDLLSDVEHARSAAKNVFINGGTLSMVKSTMRCYKILLNQKWLTKEDYVKYCCWDQNSVWNTITSEEPEDVISPLYSVLGEKRMKALSQKCKSERCDLSDILSVISRIGFHASKRKTVPEYDDSHFWGNELSAFSRSMKGCIRGLKNERGKPALFNIVKGNRFRMLVNGERLSAGDSLEHLFRDDKTPHKVKDSDILRINTDRYVILSHALSKKRPFRDFVMAGDSKQKTLITKSQLIWIDKLNNYKPPYLPTEEVNKIRGMTKEKKLEIVEELERNEGMRLMVKHSCGEPNQGLLYLKTSHLSFHAELYRSPVQGVEEIGTELLIWGGNSLSSIMSDFRRFRKPNYDKCSLAFRTNDGRKMYRSHDSRYVNMVGMVGTLVDEDIGLWRYIDDTRNVVYDLDFSDWSDIDPTEFGVRQPEMVVSPAIVCTPVQHFNWNNYSRTTNDTTMKISTRVGVKYREWCSESTSRSHGEQRVKSMSKEFKVVHIDPSCENTGLIRIQTEEGCENMICHVNSESEFSDPKLCDYCCKLQGSKRKKILRIDPTKRPRL